MLLPTRVRAIPTTSRHVLAALIGTFNHDILVHAGGEEIHSAGGLWYSLKALGLLQPDWLIRPVAWSPRADHEHIRQQLNALSLDAAGLCDTNLPANRVRLDCRADAEKPELCELNLPPLGLPELRHGLDAEVLLLNMTSGRDTTLENWAALRSEWRSHHPQGWLQMDWHSLSLNEGEKGTRRLRRVPDWQAWLKDLDLLQLTLEESFSMDGRKRNSLRDTRDLWLQASAAGCRRMVVTDGARGFVYWDHAGSRLVPAIPVKRVVDTTGCGDVLGAGLLALACGTDTDTVLQDAAYRAASVLGAAGLASLDELKGQ